MDKIMLAAKLYRCRDAAKGLFEDEFKAKIEPYTALIKATMKANNIEELPALLKISETETYRDNPMVQMMFMAAAVELIEPS